MPLQITARYLSSIAYRSACCPSLAAVMLAISLLLAQSSYHRAAAAPGLALPRAQGHGSNMQGAGGAMSDQQPVARPADTDKGKGGGKGGSMQVDIITPDPRVRSGDPVATCSPLLWFYQAAVSGKCIKPGQSRGTRQGGGEKFSFVG